MWVSWRGRMLHPREGLGAEITEPPPPRIRPLWLSALAWKFVDVFVQAQRGSELVWSTSLAMRL